VTVVLGLCSSVDSADGVLLSTLFRSLEMDLGLTPSELGMLSLFKSVSLAICLPLWGYASDIYAKYRLLTAAVLSWSVSSCVVGLALGFTTLALACALNAAVLGAIQVNPCPWPSWLKWSHRSNAVRCLGCYHWPPA
jgi:MFS family permease